MLASGKLTARASSTSGANDWHELSLSIVGTVATGMVDGVVVGATNCQKATHGMNLDLRRKMQMASHGPVEHTASEVCVEPNPSHPLIR